MTYIVEGGNWKCLVEYSDKTYRKLNDRIIEICTLAYEELFNDNINHNNVEIYQLLDESGKNFFETSIYDDVKMPMLNISIITKCYNIIDTNISKNQFYILSDILIENSSNPHLINEFLILKDKIFEEIPDMKQFIERKFIDNKIIKNIG
jgi:hypothetical protein